MGRGDQELKDPANSTRSIPEMFSFHDIVVLFVEDSSGITILETNFSFKVLYSSSIAW